MKLSSKSLFRHKIAVVELVNCLIRWGDVDFNVLIIICCLLMSGGLSLFDEIVRQCEIKGFVDPRVGPRPSFHLA